MITSKKKKFIKLGNTYVKSFNPFCLTASIDKAKNFYPFAHIIVWLRNFPFKNSKPFKIVNGLSVNAEFDTRFDMLQDKSLKAKARRGLIFFIRLIEKITKGLAK